MVLASLKDGGRLIRRTPVLWIPGAIIAVLGFVEATLAFSGELFLANNLAFLELALLPFLSGGFFGVLCEGEERTLRSFARNGGRWYFPVLLPLLVVIFAAVLTMILVAIPLYALGMGAAPGLFTAIGMGVAIPFTVFCYFYDTAAVFEGRHVFASILRSVGFVMMNGLRSLAFFGVSVLVLLGTGAVALVVWTAALSGRLMPLAEMAPEDLQAITPTDIAGMLGPEGAVISAILYAAFLLVTITVLTAYKASFFRRYAGDTEAPPAGEYDEKGRWYRY